MTRRLSHIIFMVIALLATGCIKETYDMNKLSSKVKLTQTLAISAVNGGFILSDLVESGDTIVFDQNNLIKVVFKEDSILDLKMADFYDLNDMVSFSQSYTIGELNIDPFYTTIDLSLRAISSNFSAPLAAQFAALDNTTSNFPAFPSVDMGDNAFSGITNFEQAVFASGFVEISIVNNLAAPINGVIVQLYNSVGRTPIGNQATIPPIASGNLGLASIDLTDQTVTNSIIAAIEIIGSPGTSSPVLIDLDASNIQAGIRGKDLVVKSGRVILPLQTIESLDQKDTLTFDPGTDIEIDEFKILSGNLSYTITSSSPVSASVEITLPSALRSGVAINELISVTPNTSRSENISVDNTIIDLGTDPLHPYNRVPMEYSIEISTSSTLVDFDMNDEISLDFTLLNPDFDYVKGYFGQQTESIDPESIDLNIEDVLSNISGDFLIASPSIKFNYSNSFAIPMKINLEATGRRGDDIVNLDLLPVTIAVPAAPGVRDISSTFSIDKDNSKLPALISMPPESIDFSGSASMNPSGNDGLRNNYVFGDSRIIGSLEIEVPLEFSMNLEFADTLDNFLADAFEAGSEFNWDDIESFRVDVNIDNGFPFGISLTMDLFDSSSNPPHVISSIDSPDILKPAPVDANGRVVDGVTESSVASIELSREFFNSIDLADKVILRFKMNTYNNEVVKIYSDYRLDFRVAFIVKPNFATSLK